MQSSSTKWLLEIGKQRYAVACPPSKYGGLLGLSSADVFMLGLGRLEGLLAPLRPARACQKAAGAVSRFKQT